ncbi:MAG: hypothetical protein ACRD0K_30745 [Egibacteraceae bacterium]
MRWPAGLLAVALVLLAGCGLIFDRIYDREPSMTYEEARQQARQLAEDALAAGLQGKPPPRVEPLFGDDPSCVDAWGAPVTGEVQPGLEYNFPLDHLGEEPDTFVTAAERLWRERGFAVTRDDNIPGVPTVFAVVDAGFYLKLFVNHNTDMVYVGATGPCVKSPSASGEATGPLAG